jgi:folate-dependent phosphoribosylglycinamide formyltransferase PurN
MEERRLETSEVWNIGLNRPIHVVMFGGGPRLTHDARQFMSRLEDHPEIELVGAFCQGAARSIGAILQDLWQRRGILALPLFAAWLAEEGMRFVRHPRATWALQRKLAHLSERMHFVPDIHAPEVLAQVNALSPDLGLIYGGPILKSSLFEIPKLGTLGIHHGKVPAYRGNKTYFWAMYNGEKTAGVTIQKINAGLDTGSIVKEGEVLIGHRTPGAVWLRLEAVGLDLYVQAILEIKNGIATFQPQTGRKGKLYRNPKPKDLVVFWGRWLKRRKENAS